MALFDEILMIYKSLCWFISMALRNALHPVMWFAIAVPALLALMPFLFDNARFKNLKNNADRKARLAVLPLFWTFSGIWGAAFRDRGPKVPDFPVLVLYIIPAVTLFYVVYGIYAIYKNKNYRTVSTILFLVNAYMMTAMLFIGSMSINGTWL